MNQVYISEHPLIKDKIARMRMKTTDTATFRRIAHEVSMLLAYEVLKGIKTEKQDVQTPLGIKNTPVLAQDLTVVTILRAGLAMAEGFAVLEPTAKFAHIGMYRNEDSLEPVRYYARFPKDLHKDYVVLVDPMLATGGSAIESIEALKNAGAKNICFACILAARDGIKNVRKTCPEVPIYVGDMDEELNAHGYIIPGLGDAGDRMFGTI